MFISRHGRTQRDEIAEEKHRAESERNRPGVQDHGAVRWRLRPELQRADLHGRRTEGHLRRLDLPIPRRPDPSSAMDEIKKTTGVNPEQLVVDAGFTTREAIVTAHERHIDLIGSFNETNAGWKTFLRSRGIAEAFWPKCFRFDPERNVYVCPEGRTLVYISKKTEKRKTTFNYRGKHCKDCPSRLSCCPRSTKGRSISRIENDPRVDAFLKKMETDEAKAIYKQRGEVAEFPNAWIKEKFGLRQFRLRGIVKVGMF